MNFESLPIEILEVIILYLTPINNNFDIDFFFNLRLVNKNIKSIIESEYILKDFIATIDNEEFIIYHVKDYFELKDNARGRLQIMYK